MNYNKAFKDIGKLLNDAFDFPEIGAFVGANELDESSGKQNSQVYNAKLSYILTFDDPDGEFMEQLEDRLALSLYSGDNGRSAYLIEEIQETYPEYGVVDVFFWRFVDTEEDEPEEVLIVVYLS